LYKYFVQYFVYGKFSECLSAEVIGHASVPQKRTGKHFDLINAKRTSSEALRPTFPKMLLKAFQLCS